MIYRMAPFSMTVNDPCSRFKVTPFFDAGLSATAELLV